MLWWWCSCGEQNPETAFHIRTRHNLHVLCREDGVEGVGGVGRVGGLHRQRKAFELLRGWEEAEAEGGGGVEAKQRPRRGRGRYGSGEVRQSAYSGMAQHSAPCRMRQGRVYLDVNIFWRDSRGLGGDLEGTWSEQGDWRGTPRPIVEFASDGSPSPSQ